MIPAMSAEAFRAWMADEGWSCRKLANSSSHTLKTIARYRSGERRISPAQMTYLTIVTARTPRSDRHG